MDVTKLCLEHLLKFLELKYDESAETASPVLAALRAIMVSEGNLNVLKVLSDMITYKEEVKKPKKKKGKKKKTKILLRWKLGF